MKSEAHYIGLKCKNCKFIISKPGIEKSHIKNFILNDHYSINILYLTCLLPKGKPAVMFLNSMCYLGQVLKCLNCDAKIAIKMTSASKNFLEFVDCVTFDSNTVEM
jgi:hypothetical protein